MKHGKLPKHVAIIMDGNGRWAEGRNLPRSQGHIHGVKRVEDVILVAREMGIKYITLFAFSTENWGRPQGEVSLLMKIVSKVLREKAKKLKDSNIKFHLVGKTEGIPEEVLKSIRETEEKTKKCSSMTLSMAFNYGSRVEILDAVKEISEDVKSGRIKSGDINERVFSEHLYTKELPDPDLLIRTSGEIRISNFLLWQLSYAELYFTDKCWPDFNKSEFKKAIREYQNRERRYGEVLRKGEKK